MTYGYFQQIQLSMVNHLVRFLVINDNSMLWLYCFERMVEAFAEHKMSMKKWNPPYYLVDKHVSVEKPPVLKLWDEIMNTALRFKPEANDSGQNIAPLSITYS